MNGSPKMKRSEMLKLIMTTFHEDISYKEELLYGMTTEQAENLLSVMEKAGMLPPSADIIRELECKIVGDHTVKISYIKPVHEWEPEDETR